MSVPVQIQSILVPEANHSNGHNPPKSSSVQSGDEQDREHLYWASALWNNLLFHLTVCEACLWLFNHSMNFSQTVIYYFFISAWTEAHVDLSVFKAFLNQVTDFMLSKNYLSVSGVPQVLCAHEIPLVPNEDYPPRPAEVFLHLS